jgi:hypothetical protein
VILGFAGIGFMARGADSPEPAATDPACHAACGVTRRDPEHRRRMVRRPPVAAGSTHRTRGRGVQRFDEHIDRANSIALADPIIEAFRQQRRLLAIRPLNETLHHFPRRFRS